MHLSSIVYVLLISVICPIVIAPMLAYGLLSLLSDYAKKSRDNKGYFNQIENYISDHSKAEFSHSLCPAQACYAEFKKHL